MKRNQVSIAVWLAVLLPALTWLVPSPKIDLSRLVHFLLVLGIGVSWVLGFRYGFNLIFFKKRRNSVDKP